jgi:peptidoglycan/LPS O-acetylase OafA/YrhL
MAALLVMLFHFGFWVGFMDGTHARLASQGLITYPELFPWTKYGWVGVQIFFVISGFVIAYSAEKASAYRFFVSRAVRLFPAAIICATITLAALLLVDNIPTGELFAAYLRSITLWPKGPWIDDSYWTLAIEVAFYALVLGLLLINKFKWITPLAITIGLFSIAFNLVIWLGHDLETIRQLKEKRIPELLLLHHGTFFALGIFLWLHLLKKPVKENLFWIGIFILGGCIQIFAVVTSLNYQGAGMLPYVPPLIWLTAVAMIFISIRFNAVIFSRLPEWMLLFIRRIGLMTYPLYLIHQNAMLAAMGGIAKLGAHPYLALATGISGALILSWAISVYMEPRLQKSMKTALQNLPEKLTLRTAAASE